MWQCTKCGEEIDDPFEACWNCGTSKDGVADPEFESETDAAEAGTPPENRWRLNAFWAAAIVTGVAGFVVFLVPPLVLMSNSPATRKMLGMYIVLAAAESFLVSCGGGLAGWIGSKTDRMAIAACRGVLILFVVQGLLNLLTGFVVVFIGMPAPKALGLLAAFASLGAIAGSVGRIVGRPNQDVKTAEERVQFRIADVLFFMLLFSCLFASIAVLAR